MKKKIERGRERERERERDKIFFCIGKICIESKRVTNLQYEDENKKSQNKGS